MPSDQIWMQSHGGRVVDLMNFTPADVDFRQIANTLANINRYNGCGAGRQVSVAFHTVICIDLAQSHRMKQLMALHDGHESVIGDITTPAALAIEETANEMYGHGRGYVVKSAIKQLKTKLDIAIHAAAGVDMPNEEERAVIATLDLRALNTERRDFLLPAPKSWGERIEYHRPSSRVWTDNWLPPAEMADLLHGHFQRLFKPNPVEQVAA